MTVVCSGDDDDSGTDYKTACKAGRCKRYQGTEAG